MDKITSLGTTADMISIGNNIQSVKNGNSIGKAAEIIDGLDKVPAIKDLNSDIARLRSMKQDLNSIMKNPKEKWTETCKALDPSFYMGIQESVKAKEQSNAFRITAGIWLAGCACAFGAIASIFVGSPGMANILGYQLPATLALGTGSGRLYQWAANKWIINKKTDKIVCELLTKKSTILEDQLDIKLKQKDLAVSEYMTAKTNLPEENSLAEDTSSKGVQNIEDELIDIAGVKIKINHRTGLLQSIPMNFWGGYKE